MATKYAKLDQSQSKVQELEKPSERLLDGDEENEGDSVALEMQPSDSTSKPAKTPLSLYLKTYYRVYTTLGPERRLANFLAVSNIIISIALLAEPVLFSDQPHRDQPYQRK